jgi:hypothetical protein
MDVTQWYNHEHRHTGIGLHPPPADTPRGEPQVSADQATGALGA